VTEASGTEIKPGELWEVFSQSYLPDDAGIRLISSEVSSTKGASGESTTRVVAQVLVDGRHETLSGTGNGPVAALIDGLRAVLGLDLVVRDYTQHAMTAGTEASAAAYVEVVDPRGGSTWGVGMDSSTLDASLGAVISAANRLRGRAADA
jgi:2-isopropylmalate synthase